MAAEEHALAVKLPTFWSSQPDVWFAQVEAQFHLRRITTDETKYYHVLAALDQETATRLIDLISSPPADDKYTTLKTRLTETFGLSERERASRLLHFRPLGDSKPSVLMDQMLALLGSNKPCFLFAQLFLERLPEDIRIQLVDSKFDNPRELAQRADKLWLSRDMATISAVHRNRPLPSKKPKSQPKVQVVPQAPALQDSSEQVCYYHRIFGEAARKCSQPCTWAGKGQASR